MQYQLMYQVLYRRTGERRWNVEAEYTSEDDALEKQRLMRGVYRDREVKIEVKELNPNQP